ncbi:hypothetical protein CCC_02441 [Paramagnetospirillum magnetotacticum MS-1]|uniref:Cyclophilin TM1367-like domain-containing protein n=1 Tax=Paramagnetospirillum magnetotacticum MS-1 TaxID=272627 RepID=A0A0C2V1M3_PARME|nr:cyclophilin-like fold protein [Paramagnetospirillum magnetotacticum]KIL98991.1 hypothetical protein CCC_02441 [Paramagnetospirillum magnetotacticum MS-1]
MRKLKISIGHHVLNIDLYDTATADAVLAAVPFEARAATWQGEVYFQAPIHADREDTAREVVEAGELAFRHEGEAVVIAYGPTPCSEGDEIRLAVPANIFGRTGDSLAFLSGVEAGALVRIEAAGESEG